MSVAFQAGVARTRLTPPWGVELAGWGYYLGRTWKRVRDHTAATALVLDDGEEAVALVAVDLLYADASFTADVRRLACADTGLRAESICVASSHSHNTPTLALIRGAGEINPDYHAWAARQTATALILAWKQRRPARFTVGRSEVNGWTYNRTRAGGPVDTRLSVWRIGDREHRPFAAVVNFQAHPVIAMSLGADEVSRDNPGEITDILEATNPGLTVLYLQGSCGDVNYAEQWNNPTSCHEPGRAVASLALEAFDTARPVDVPRVKAVALPVVLPTRRWTHAEIQADREEAEYRLRTGDTAGWLDGLARACVNHPDKLPQRYGGDVGRTVQAVCRFGMEWTTEALQDLETRPESLTTEVQSVRVGDAFLVTNGSELFTTLALETRRQWGRENLMIVGYANDSIGYVPDAYEIERGGYAATQSPKFKNQFPFTAASGPALVQGMLDTLDAVTKC